MDFTGVRWKAPAVLEANFRGRRRSDDKIRGHRGVSRGRTKSGIWDEMARSSKHNGNAWAASGQKVACGGEVGWIGWCRCTRVCLAADVGG